MRQLRLWCWLGATLLYGYLFYNQAIGVNILLFTVALVTAVFALQPALRYQRTVVALAVGCLFTGILTAWHPTWATIIMNAFSLLAFSSLSQRPQVSMVATVVHAAYSMVASFFQHVFRPATAADNTSNESATVATAGITFDKLVSYGAPLLVAAVFFVLYLEASPAFSALFTNLSLDFISLGWVLFTMFGGYLLFAFFYPLVVKPLAEADEAAADQLVRQRRSPLGLFNPVGLRYEYQAGGLLFALLNGLLLLFNTVDAFYLLTLRLPEGVTHTAFLHQGVYALIISVVLAIGVVMYFFRGNLNFLQNNRWLRYAAYGWIGQNALLVVLTGIKNFNYIDEYGLTHKRVGVYVYLLLTLIGLATTYLKVRDKKSNWFLFRKNAWAFYAVLLLYSTIDWTRAIAKYNISRFDSKRVGVEYLLRLSDAHLDLLEEARHTYNLPFEQDIEIKSRVRHFLKQERREEWLAWNYRDYVLMQRLRKDH